MKDFFRRISPRRALGDFFAHWQEPTPHRWQILGVACAATFALFVLFVPENQRVRPEPPDVMFISTLEDGRSDADIIAANCANQQLQDDLAAQIAKSEERKREVYRQLGRATFIDVEEMEREAEASRAADAADEPTEEELALSIEEYCARATG